MLNTTNDKKLIQDHNKLNKAMSNLKMLQLKVDQVHRY